MSPSLKLEMGGQHSQSFIGDINSNINYYDNSNSSKSSLIIENSKNSNCTSSNNSNSKAMDYGYWASYFYHKNGYIDVPLPDGFFLIPRDCVLLPRLNQLLLCHATPEQARSFWHGVLYSSNQSSHSYGLQSYTSDSSSSASTTISSPAESNSSTPTNDSSASANEKQRGGSGLSSRHLDNGMLEVDEKGLVPPVQPMLYTVYLRDRDVDLKQLRNHVRARFENLNSSRFQSKIQELINLVREKFHCHGSHFWTYIFESEAEQHHIGFNIATLCKGLSDEMALLFKVLCDIENIDCRMVRGKNPSQKDHTWNFVLDRERGKWFFIDVMQGLKLTPNSVAASDYLRANGKDNGCPCSELAFYPDLKACYYAKVTIPTFNLKHLAKLNSSPTTMIPASATAFATADTTSTTTTTKITTTTTTTVPSPPPTVPSSKASTPSKAKPFILVNRKNEKHSIATEKTSPRSAKISQKQQQQSQPLKEVDISHQQSQPLKEVDISHQQQQPTSLDLNGNENTMNADIPNQDWTPKRTKITRTPSPTVAPATVLPTFSSSPSAANKVKSNLYCTCSKTFNQEECTVGQVAIPIPVLPSSTMEDSLKKKIKIDDILNHTDMEVKVDLEKPGLLGAIGDVDMQDAQLNQSTLGLSPQSFGEAALDDDTCSDGFKKRKIGTENGEDDSNKTMNRLTLLAADSLDMVNDMLSYNVATTMPSTAGVIAESTTENSGYDLTKGSHLEGNDLVVSSALASNGARENEVGCIVDVDDISNGQVGKMDTLLSSEEDVVGSDSLFLSEMDIPVSSSAFTGPSSFSSSSSNISTLVNTSTTSTSTTSATTMKTTTTLNEDSNCNNSTTISISSLVNQYPVILINNSLSAATGTQRRVSFSANPTMSKNYEPSAPVSELSQSKKEEATSTSSSRSVLVSISLSSPSSISTTGTTAISSDLNNSNNINLIDNGNNSSQKVASGAKLSSTLSLPDKETISSPKEDIVRCNVCGGVIPQDSTALPTETVHNTLDPELSSNSSDNSSNMEEAEGGEEYSSDEDEEVKAEGKEERGKQDESKNPRTPNGRKLHIIFRRDEQSNSWKPDRRDSVSSNSSSYYASPPSTPSTTPSTPTSTPYVKSASPVNNLNNNRPRSDPNAPKAPPSSFNLFTRELWKAYKDTDAFKDFPISSIGRFAGERWRQLSDAERQPYLEEAKRLRREHAIDVAKYRESDAYQEYQKYLEDWANSDKLDNNLPSYPTRRRSSSVTPTPISPASTTSSPTVGVRKLSLQHRRDSKDVYHQDSAAKRRRGSSYDFSIDDIIPAAELITRTTVIPIKVKEVQVPSWKVKVPENGIVKEGGYGNEEDDGEDTSDEHYERIHVRYEKLEVLSYMRKSRKERNSRINSLKNDGTSTATTINGITNDGKNEDITMVDAALITTDPSSMTDVDDKSSPKT